VSPDVLVIGGGPAGLAAATELRRLGVGSVMLIERDGELGGVPRHCAHSPYGMREFGRVFGGMAYATALRQRAEVAGVDIRPRHSAVRIEPGPTVTIASPEGTLRLSPRAVLNATGIRETSRAAQLVPGTRPLGILTTGALQDYVHLRGLAPFRRPVIVGSELVTMSAFLTCRDAGIRPVAMLESEAAPRVGYPTALFPHLLGVPVHYGARIEDIVGNTRVEALRYRDRHGQLKTLECDGVLFTGRFTPEASLLRLAAAEIDGPAGGPRIDAAFRTSLPSVYAAGNVLRAVRTAGHCWSEGRRAAAVIAADLAAGPGNRAA
jgi:thioredoxin reductase